MRLVPAFANRSAAPPPRVKHVRFAAAGRPRAGLGGGAAARARDAAMAAAMADMQKQVERAVEEAGWPQALMPR